jgi:hypothetical protein
MNPINRPSLFASQIVFSANTPLLLTAIEFRRATRAADAYLFAGSYGKMYRGRPSIPYEIFAGVLF